MAVKQTLASLVKLVVGAAIYFVGFILGSLIAGWMGLPAPALPEGTDAQTLGAYQLVVSLIFTLTLALLSRRLAGPFLLRWPALAIFGWVVYSLNTYLEAVIFTTVEAASAYTLVMQAVAIALCSLAVAWMFPPAAAEAAGPKLKAFLGRFSPRQWAWRMLAAWAAFPVIYLAFGWLVQPFVVEFYRQQLAGLTLPGWGQILPTQALRSLLFLLACLPVLSLWRGSGRQRFLLLGGALFVFVGGLYMLQAYWYPPVIRVAHGLEILADSFVYAGALTLLLAQAEKTGSPSNREPGPVRRFGKWLARTGQAVAPGPRAWRGAAWGALVVLVLILLTTARGLFGRMEGAWLLTGGVLFLAVFFLAGGLLALAWQVLKGLPTFYVWMLASGALVLANLALTAWSVPVGIVGVGFGALAAASLIGAGVASLGYGGGAGLSRIRRIVAAGGLALGLAGLIGGGAWLLDAGSPLAYPPNAAALSGARVAPLDLPDPAQPGPHSVRTLFYGSGEDRRRPEYGATVDLVTAPVDGSALVERWSGLRSAYWGFGPGALPLNGRVWYPGGGDGPFPLVLIVHGQHPMDDFSDPGYAYLGELLASRGFIAVSVDENFLNLSPLADLLMVQTLIEPDDLRGWLLLEHLRLWRDWNGDPGSVFYQLVDLDRIALIGHSRGGLAVAVAAAFNKLPCYPDDGALRFDYGFHIRSLVGVAPADGGYRPAERDIVLEDVNYLVLQGAHDMDVFTFQGNRQYARVRFTPGGGDRLFKAAVYIYGANHGQFNTGWGRKDLFEPVMRVFNLEQLMPGEEQQRIAQVTVSAFLEATLRGESGYRDLFRDLRRGRAWLPETIYLQQYEDAATQMVSTFEEDVDLSTTTLPGGRLAGENLTVWRERPAAAKWGNLGDQTVYLGWDARATGGTASYAIRVPPQALALTGESVLVLAMADANEDPTPETEEVGAEVEGFRPPIDLTVAVVDGAGEEARLPLSHFSLLQPQLEGQLGKARFMSPFPASEAVLQHFEYPLADFAAANPAFDPAGLAEVRLVFDRTEAGVVVLDNVGFRNTE